MSIHILDTPEVYRSQDPRGMLRHLHDFPTICQDAWQLASDFALPPSYRTVKKVVVLGMGGSAIGADLIAGMNECKVPIIVCRGYTLPPFVDEDTLVIASSYSGTTEETNSAFAKALTGPAKKLIMTTGGKLKELASRHSLPCFTFAYTSPPRAALPYSIIPLFAITAKLGFFHPAPHTIDDAFAVLANLSDTIIETQPYEQNPAKKLAQALYDKVCIIYGSEFLSEVGHRWKLQINENAKAWSSHESFPELTHNTIVGYRFPREIQSKIIVAMLSSHLLDERIRQRYLVTQALLKTASVNYHVVLAHGPSKLAQMLELIMLGDYVSYYLAILNQTDPYPLDEVDYMKDKLSKYGENEGLALS